MNKIYLVNRCFDVDGGFGDAIPQEEVICGFDNREDANRFVEKYSNPHIYDRLFWKGETKRPCNRWWNICAE